jgi:hypothetical protein
LSARLLALALAATLTVGLAACGEEGDDLLPGETASEINSNLDAVEELVAEGDCIGAEDAAAAVTGQVENLSGIDAKLKRALSEGAARLNEVIAECDEATSEDTVEAIEPAEEPEEEEKEKLEKPAKEKPEKEEPEESEEEGEGPTLPPQSNGKGEEKGGGNEPPVEPEAPSGGVGPGAAVGEG